MLSAARVGMQEEVADIEQRKKNTVQQTRSDKGQMRGKTFYDYLQAGVHRIHRSLNIHHLLGKPTLGRDLLWLNGQMNESARLPPFLLGLLFAF